MMKLLNKAKITLSAILLLALMAGMIPTVLAEGSFQAVVKSNSMKVYATSGKHKYLGSLSKGTEVTVLDYAKGIAKISYKGKTGLAYVKDMKAAEEADDSAESTQSVPAVALQKIKVYKKASTSSKYTTVKAGTEMNVLAVSGKFAKVEKNGAVGYALKKYLGDPDEVKAEEEKQESSVTTLTLDVVTNRSTKIYKKASTSSKYVTVPKGTEMTVIAVNGDCARVERNGVVGYAYKSHLTEKSDAALEDTPVKDTVSDKQEDTSAQDKNTATTDKKEETGKQDSTSGATTTGSSSSGSSIFDSSYSNEQIIYMFLTKKMGYNSAAALGIMANIKYESGYRPDASGDNSASYGICQWYSGRKAKLINWCDENGYDYHTLEGQLYYLQHDLTKSYTKVHNYLKSVENTAEGAYDAGYYFCYHFEGPSSKASKSVTRGNYAKNTLWDRYN